MKLFFPKLLLIGGGVIAVSVLATAWLLTNYSQKQDVFAFTEAQPCLPTFKDGGGPYYLPDQPFRENIAPNENDGERLVVQGRLLESDCSTPISEGVLDIWQANEDGNYENEWYRGQVVADEQGFYAFETVIPLGYGEGTAYRPPHIHFKVHIDGEEQITSQMFFPEIQGTPGFKDEYIMAVDTKTPILGEPIHYGYHNIILP